MSDPDLVALADEAERQRLGVRWLAEIREACAQVSRRYDPSVYAVAERSWTAGEIDDLVQDVTVEQLLRQGQLDYVLDVAGSIDDVRRLLRQQVRRVLVRRRRRTVVDQLLARIGPLLGGDRFEVLPGLVPARYRPVGSELGADPPPGSALRAAAAAVRMLPTTGGGGDRAPAVYRSEVLEQAVDVAFTTASASLAIDDFGTILREALTSWVPVVLEGGEELDQPSADPADLPFELEETVEALLQAIDEDDRTVLRAKLAGTADAALAEQLGVSRPTAAKRKAEAFGRLRAAWTELAGDLPNEASVRLVQELYLRLRVTGVSGG